MSADYEGREVSEAETARSLGFVNVEAFREYQRRQHSTSGNEFTLLADVCNLKQQVAALERRLEATGAERMG